MQLDFFAAEPEVAPPPALQLLEHDSPHYRPRTSDNARGADVTVAFAVDFETAGERLTKRVAGAKYVGIPFGSAVATAAATLLKFMAPREARSLNVAGNGVYTLARKGITQAKADRWVYEVLALVHKTRPLSFIRSGGQTGVDAAGLVAGLALNIPVLGLYPLGFRQRLANGIDVDGNPEELEAQLRNSAAALLAA